MSALLFFPIHGRASSDRADADGLSAPARHPLGIYALWNDPARRSSTSRGYGRRGSRSQPYVPGGVYVNELGEDEGDNRVQQAYAWNFARLRTIKRKYDPDNLFCLNANIKP